tara:strand:+ start:1511 stop:1774 length:264 start_codon:yes stop_codon:yes gene_type:complete
MNEWKISGSSSERYYMVLNGIKLFELGVGPVNLKTVRGMDVEAEYHSNIVNKIKELDHKLELSDEFLIRGILMQQYEAGLYLDTIGD